LLDVLNYGTARATAQPSLFDRMTPQAAAKVDNNKQLTSVVLQELDSKDKIATRLQPPARKYSHRPLAALRPPMRPTFALTRSAHVLGFKGLAIMNFL
jgi:hypothetical protein